jgi:hypothetical protein
VSRAEGEVHLHKLEHHIRSDLDASSARRLAVLRPLRVVVTSLPEGHLEEVEAKVRPPPPRAVEGAGWWVDACGWMAVVAAVVAAAVVVVVVVVVAVTAAAAVVASVCVGRWMPAGDASRMSRPVPAGVRHSRDPPETSSLVPWTFLPSLWLAGPPARSLAAAAGLAVAACPLPNAAHSAARYVPARPRPLPPAPRVQHFPGRGDEGYRLPFTRVLHLPPAPRVQHFPGRGDEGYRLPFTRVLYIEATDFREDDSKDYYGLAPGKTVMLRRARAWVAGWVGGCGWVGGGGHTALAPALCCGALCLL